MKNTALLIMDVQTRIVGMLPDSTQLVKNIKTAIDYAHKKSIPVIYVAVQFRSGFPEVSQNNKSFSAIKENQSAFGDPKEMEIYPKIKPEKQDLTVIKKRVSAFTGSDLEVILRSLGVGHIVLTGIATSGVVLSTVREAADKDYQITVLSDCCADRDEDVHDILISKVLPRQADVKPVAAWIKE
jgi:nicotinamidase-related amidase